MVMQTPLYNSWFVDDDAPGQAFVSDDEADLAFTEALAERFMHQFTEPGDVVLDPFAGFGTTLVVAQRLSCIGIGIEIEPERYHIIKERVGLPSRVILGDARQADLSGLPAAALLLTSPPYWDGAADAFTNYRTPAPSYDSYLAELQAIMARFKPLLLPNAAIVVVVQNMQSDDGPTLPFAWDVGRALSKLWTFERDVIACKVDDEPNDFGNHQYCLVFHNR